MFIHTYIHTGYTLMYNIMVLLKDSVAFALTHSCYIFWITQVTLDNLGQFERFSSPHASRVQPSSVGHMSALIYTCYCINLIIQSKIWLTQNDTHSIENKRVWCCFRAVPYVSHVCVQNVIWLTVHTSYNLNIKRVYHTCIDHEIHTQFC